MLARRGGFRYALLVLGLLTACSPLPHPSASTAALEDALLSLEEVGGRFEEESRGQIAVSGWGLCDRTDFEFDDVGMVSAAFVQPSDGSDRVELVEMMYVVESGGIGALMAELSAAFESCDGVVWTDYGTIQTVEVIDAPEIGDARIAVRRIDGVPPFDEDFFAATHLYVCKGDVFIDISTDVGSVGEDEFYRIAAAAVDRVPG